MSREVVCFWGVNGSFWDTLLPVPFLGNIIACVEENGRGDVSPSGSTYTSRSVMGGKISWLPVTRGLYLRLFVFAFQDV